MQRLENMGSLGEGGAVLTGHSVGLERVLVQMEVSSEETAQQVPNLQIDTLSIVVLKILLILSA